ncbi:MAG: substrate-binding domain-containing protein, partial [Desulfobacteraceae bacterium]|nr:substrate-binding domain-containing protein [Desulfobacteraceae bacterium]
SRKRIYLIICIAFFLFIVVHISHARPLQIVFLNPAVPEDTFWRQAENFMRAASVDLGIQLKVAYAERNQRKMISQFTAIAKDKNKPDAVVFQNLKNNAVNMLQIAEKAKIPVFLFNATLSDSHRAAHGNPREKFTQWLGEMVPDDEYAGYALCTYLGREAKKRALSTAAGQVRILAINGARTDGAGVEREKGLNRAGIENPDFQIYPPAFGNWDQDLAQMIYLRSKRTYKNINVIWAANDPMALGAIEGMVKSSEVPGKDILVGGIDWTRGALESIQKGEMSISIGGHFMEGGWAMVLLYDYFNGTDFSSTGVSMKSQMSAITQDNIDQAATILGTGDWGKIDFTRFSKTFHPDLTEYEFGLDAILNQLSN